MMKVTEIQITLQQTQVKKVRGVSIMFIYAKKELSEQLEHRGYKKIKGNDYYDVYVF